jgi:hypothetical protein
MTQGKGRHLPHERASLIFLMATTLLHELAHAASYHIMGHRPEDFFEDVLVAEAGFEHESQILGMVPCISRKHPLNSAWIQWQNLSFLHQESYPVNETCRNTPKLSTVPVARRFNANFAMRLLSDDWWGQSADRSTDLVPDFLLRRENAHLLATAPASVRDWIRGTAHRQHKATEIPHSRLRPRLRVRQPTPSSHFTASTLEADPESSIKDGILCPEPLPCPESAEDIRRVVPTHGGIYSVHLEKRFSILRLPLEEIRFKELVDEACRFDHVSGSYFLRENEDRTGDAIDVCW